MFVQENNSLGIGKAVCFLIHHTIFINYKKIALLFALQELMELFNIRGNLALIAFITFTPTSTVKNT